MDSVTGSKATMALPEDRAVGGRSLPSLRLRLMLVIVVCLAVGVPASAVLDYRDSISLANEAYDHAIASSAEIIADAVAPLASDRERMVAAARDIGARVVRSDADDDVRFAVVAGDGLVLAGDENLRAFTADPAARQAVFADTRFGKQPWRVVTLPIDGVHGFSVVVAESMGRRNEVAGDILGNVVYVNVLVFLLLALVLVLATGWVLEPLLRLGRAVDARRPDDLSPLALQGLPSEAGSLVGAINRLLGRLKAVHADEQAFLSAAAHQLRTPLATLRARLELARAGTGGETARRLEEVIASSRELSHSTHQMLALARARDSADGTLEMEAVDVSSLLTSVADQCLDRALGRGIDLGFDVRHLRLRGARWLLREALLNLVDNALLHASGATRVTIGCRAEAGSVLLEVEDDGHGIAVDDRDRLFERFRRGETTASGSGLGLAIVRAAAEAHGGTVTLEMAAGDRGSRFVMHLPGA